MRGTGSRARSKKRHGIHRRRLRPPRNCLEHRTREFGRRDGRAAGARAMSLSLFIFDVEGTLVDAVPATLRCWQETLRAFGFEFSIERLHRHSGRDGHEMLEALLPGAAAERLSRDLLDAQGRRYREKYLTQVEAFPAIRELFERIKRERQLIALATSASRDELAYYQERMGVADLVDAAVCGDDVSHEKPDSALLEVALLRAGSIPPGQAVMIGDSPYDAVAARRAGVAAIGMLTGGFSIGHLRAVGCIAVYRDPAGLLRNIETAIAFGNADGGSPPA